jgi:hypothetical protein
MLSGKPKTNQQNMRRTTMTKTTPRPKREFELAERRKCRPKARLPMSKIIEQYIPVGEAMVNQSLTQQSGALTVTKIPAEPRISNPMVRREHRLRARLPISKIIEHLTRTKQISVTP